MMVNTLLNWLLSAISFSDMLQRMETFFTRIDELLTQRGTTQKALAEHIGTSAQVFANWKIRNSIPSADTAVKIADFLRTSVEYLVNGDTKAKDKQADKQQKAVQKELEKIIASANAALQKLN